MACLEAHWPLTRNRNCNGASPSSTVSYSNGTSHPYTWLEPVARDCDADGVIATSRMQSLPPPMRFSPTSSEPLHDILRWVLRGHRIDVIELLRFPAISAILNPTRPRASVTSPAENGAMLPYSVTILRLAREYLDNAVYRIETNAEGLLHRHQGSWLTVRSCTRSALALLGAKLQSQEDHSGVISSILPATWRDAVIQVLQMLTAWETESRDVLRLREIIEGLLSACYDDGT